MEPYDGEEAKSMRHLVWSGKIWVVYGEVIGHHLTTSITSSGEIHLFKTQSRLKLVLLGVGLALAEGLLKVILPAFPLTEVFAAQTLFIGGYLGVRTVNNVKGYGNNNDTYAD